MHRMLSGIETEYGLAIEGRGAEDQLHDSMTLVRDFPGECFAGWDYSFETPRKDLRGFSASLHIDPVDAEFDQDAKPLPAEESRADRILTNGARFYNDHGHPEYATPECWSLDELVLHDKAGEMAVTSAAKAYGTHDSCLAPRSLGFERLYKALAPILVARWPLCGAGKAGDRRTPFQISQRADFFSESASIDTLHQRPVFNTRDEPHADARDWIRLHVISVDANMMSACTKRRVGLMRLAVRLCIEDAAPQWNLLDPAKAGKDVSRAIDHEDRIDLERGSWTTSRIITESYLDAADNRLDLTDEESEQIKDCRELLELRDTAFDSFATRVDWAAKLQLMRQLNEEDGVKWGSPTMQSIDLAYHLLDETEGLFPALIAAAMVDGEPDPVDVQKRLTAPSEGTRALARAAAITNLRGEIATASWGAIRFKDGTNVQLPPDVVYSQAILGVESTKEFLQLVSEASAE
jgi:proteasome accessory factor A